ncbi:MAG: DUF1657 domain-containing protein [Dethiobacteria bacterium]|jgi:BMFP domain-containing protein YqiC|nr:DUF1657 domain-containing protein [Bacillota bacterium]
MTVGQKVKTTLASLKSCQADLESFALETQDQSAKQMFNQFAVQTRSIIEGLESRLSEIEQQEPQYKQHYNRKTSHMRGFPIIMEVH